MAKHGGKIEPDGRAPVAPGVGKSARRHDLEAPKTPGLSGSDLQQGDVQRLEQAQQVAPISGKRVQPAAQGGEAPRRNSPAQGGSPFVQGEVPDPIAFAGDRVGGSAIGADSAETEPLDVEKWKPLILEIAKNPNLSGPLTTTLLATLSNQAGIVNSSGVRIIDQNAADVALRESL